MSATVTPVKINVSLKLNNGTDTKGNVKTLSLSLGSMSLTGFDADKVMSVADKISPILTKAVYRIEKTETSTITV